MMMLQRLRVQVVPMTGTLPPTAHQMLHRSALVLHLKALPVRAATLRKSMLQTALQSLQALQASPGRRRPNQCLLHHLEH